MDNQPIPAKDGAFSWKTYKPPDGELMAETVKSGAIHRAEITTNGSINVGAVSVPAKSLGVHSSSKIVIVFLIIGTTVGGIVILLRGNVRHSNKP